MRDIFCRTLQNLTTCIRVSMMNKVPPHFHQRAQCVCNFSKQLPIYSIIMCNWLMWSHNFTCFIMPDIGVKKQAAIVTLGIFFLTQAKPDRLSQPNYSNYWISYKKCDVLNLTYTTINIRQCETKHLKVIPLK